MNMKCGVHKAAQEEHNMESGSEWVKKSIKPSNISPLGISVADLLGEVFDGIYHLERDALQRVDWDEDQYIAIRLSYMNLSTFDLPHLTRLVVLSHDRCLRMSISAVGHNILELIFHQRQRLGRISERMPTIEEHIAHIRKEA